MTTRFRNKAAQARYHRDGTVVAAFDRHVFVTDDKDVIAYLKDRSDYGNTMWLDADAPSDAPVAEESVVLTDSRTTTSVKEANSARKKAAAKRSGN